MRVPSKDKNLLKGIVKDLPKLGATFATTEGFTVTIVKVPRDRIVETTSNIGVQIEFPEGFSFRAFYQWDKYCRDVLTREKAVDSIPREQGKSTITFYPWERSLRKADE